MFSKLSRYRKLAQVTAPDSKGRQLAAVELRLLPDVPGTFRHTVQAGDRHDQLAYKYYSQPLWYWNICDANPDFLSPFALLDQDVVVTTTFPVTTAATPPWAAAIAAVRALAGVEDVRVSEEIALVWQAAVGGGQILVEKPSRAILVTYNKLNADPSQIAAAIETAGFTVSPFSDIGQVGQEITIPPKPTV